MSDIFIKDNINGILESILLIEDRFTSVKEPDDFVISQNGTLLLDSISMRLQIIGELIKKIEKADAGIFDNYSQVNWVLIMRLRDIISHHYESIDHEIIFDICKNHIPILKTTISKILKDLST